MIYSDDPTHMKPKRSRRKPDLIALLTLLVVIGVSVTLIYQVHIYYGGAALPIAEQVPRTSAVGG